jgi:superfamily I DNA/RNA helicase
MNESEPHYVTRLNPAQKEAVLATEGPISVLAGAGSGKTSVLTTRIYHLIRTGVPAEQILAVTFTNKAAREMRERLVKMLPDSPLPFVATFHGLGRELLQTYGTAIGVSRYFSIFDRNSFSYLESKRGGANARRLPRETWTREFPFARRSGCLDSVRRHIEKRKSARLR